ncbi:SGNH/GDSL hydrolase family protein [Nocardioides plantarum]|uniref:SGNH/GDSL hydrolase family protein n=1 Tax=Nocardioides plantarum TaxID=29299 RepID=A0ABV5KCE5_9ACTN|nr:SGNH/GDSL hydrolase family protein [Nocardioides plantarum]
MTGRRRAGVLAVVAAVALTSLGVARATGDAPQGCERSRIDAAERRALDTGPTGPGRSAPDIVVIGDSWSVGTGVGPGESWPVRLPGRVHVDGFGGSGFSETASDCHGASYADRAARAIAGHPDALVVVEGGLNDVDQGDRAIEHGFVRLLGALAGHRVVVVGPAPAPVRATRVGRVDAVLARTATGFGATYVSMLGADVDYQDDDLHPSVRGHRQFGDLVAAAVADHLR